MSIRVYLDTSVYKRPFDDQTQPRIWLETMALSVILQMIENGLATLVSSTVLEYENSRNSNLLRQAWMKKVAQFAVEVQPVNNLLRERAVDLEKAGLKPIDALHVACAESARVDYFITGDDRLINRYQHLRPPDAGIIICNPTEFVRLTEVNE